MRAGWRPAETAEYSAVAGSFQKRSFGTNPALPALGPAHLDSGGCPHGQRTPKILIRKKVSPLFRFYLHRSVRGGPAAFRWQRADRGQAAPVRLRRSAGYLVKWSAKGGMGMR